MNVNIDEPRQIRPRRTNELVLRETVIKFGSRERKQDSNSNTNEEINDNKRAKTSSPNISSSSPKETKSPKQDDAKTTTTSKSRTSIIKQLFTRKTTDFTPQSSPKRTPSPAKKRFLLISFRILFLFQYK